MYTMMLFVRKFDRHKSVFVLKYTKHKKFMQIQSLAKQEVFQIVPRRDLSHVSHVFFRYCCFVFVCEWVCLLFLILCVNVANLVPLFRTNGWLDCMPATKARWLHGTCRHTVSETNLLIFWFSGQKTVASKNNFRMCHCCCWCCWNIHSQCIVTESYSTTRRAYFKQQTWGW